MTPYTVPLVAAAVISAGLLVITYRSREKRGAVPLAGVLFAATLWATVDAVKVATTSRFLKVVMNDVRFLGPTLITASVFLFAATYTNRDYWLTRRRIAGLFAVHAATLLLVATNGLHHLVRRGVRLTDAPGFVMMEIQWGPWYYLHALYSYVLLVAAALMLVDKLLRSDEAGPYRGQTLTILVATVVPWGMNAAFIAGLTEADLTPLGFTVTGVMFVVALFRYQMFDLVPIARSRVVDSIDEGYLVLDAEDTVVDVNSKAAEIIGDDKETLIGLSLQTLYRDYPEVLERFAAERDTREQIRIEQDGEIRYYDVDISPIHDRRDRLTGRVVLFHDITEQERRKRELQRQKARVERQKARLEHQNEQLDDFASVVSHDLRNPISVIQGRIQLARADPDEEHFDSMEQNVERMENIIDDVLATARQGQTVEETEPIDLEALCRDAWGNVDTENATLTVAADRTIEGDRTRLLQVFENLFRNAVEHGGPEVSVAVGDLTDGFYVEDDGPGIPEDKRESVLEKGFTTSDDGTGFGLSIVKKAIDAHGWNVAVREGINGGARFEVTGIEKDVSPAVGRILQD